jgi:glycosyltransferase involved in cell wall biosynthesis
MALAAAGGFAKAGYEVINVYLSGPVDNPLAKQLPYRCVDEGDSGVKHDGRAIVKELQSVLRQEAGDVVIAHRYHTCKLAVRASRGLSLKRKVAVFHGMGNLKRWRRKLFAWLFLRDWQFAGVSRAVVADIRGSGAVRINRLGVHHVRNGLDIKAIAAAQLDRKDARRRLGLPPEGFIFGHVGTLSDRKNQKTLISAYACIAASSPSSRLILIGKGPREAELRSLVAQRNLQGRVIFKGFVPHAELYLKAFDLFVFPSRSEAFGLALLEAMIARVPVIVSHVDGIRELVGRHYPFMVQPDDIKTLAAHMAAMAAKPAVERDQIASGLYTRAAEQYDISRMEAAYLKIIGPPS